MPVDRLGLQGFGGPTWKTLTELFDDEEIDKLEEFINMKIGIA
jgi:hypothetical protein